MARRDNGTGTVCQRPNGSWVGRIYMGRGADGKPKYKCFSGKNQAEVKRKIKEFNQGGCKTDSTKVSVEEYILNWLKLYKKGSIKDSSYKLYFTTASTLITISTQAGVGTPLIFVAAFTNYNTKKVTATTNIRAFILVPP